MNNTEFLDYLIFRYKILREEYQKVVGTKYNTCDIYADTDKVKDIVKKRYALTVAGQIIEIEHLLKIAKNWR